MKRPTSKHLFDITPESNDSCCNTRAQTKSELYYVAEQKATETLYFPFILKNGTR